MKRIILLFFLLGLIFCLTGCEKDCTCETEHTLTLQPSNYPGEILVAMQNGADIKYNNQKDLAIMAWTVNSAPTFIRSILRFDFSSIPQSSTIVSANLYLYSYPAPPINGNLIDANFGPTNAMLVQQVSASWSPSTITWFNQPAGITTNQITIPHTTSSFLDLNIDVTGMVSSMVNTNSNNGFLLKLQNEVIYNSRIFVASYNTTYPDKRPKLVIVYR